MAITALASTPKELYKHVLRGSSESYLKKACAEYEVARLEFMGENGESITNLAYEFITTCESFVEVPYVRSCVTALDQQFQTQTRVLELAMDQAFTEIDFAGVLSKDVVAQCLFAPICIVDIGRQEGPRTMETDGEIANLNETYIRVVKFTDLSLDPDATSWNDKRFVGQRVSVKKSKIALSNSFGVDDHTEAAEFGLPVMTTAEAAEWFALKAEVPQDGTTRSNRAKKSIQKRDQGSAATNRPQQDEEVILWRVAVYNGNECWIVYIADSEAQPDKFIHAERWDAIKKRPDGLGGELELGGGSPLGPFRACSFQDVPGSILGISGIRIIFDLHNSAKKLSSKYVKELLGLKNIFMYKKGAEADAGRVVKARDQDSVAVQDPSNFATIAIGGTRNELVPGMEWLGQAFGNQAGGVRQIGGSEQSASTATAASYLQNGATMKMSRFRNRIWKLAKDCAKEIAYLTLFADPWAYREMQMEIAPNVDVLVAYNRSKMAADAINFMFDVEPFPVPIFDPSMKAQQATQFLSLVMNFLPGIQMGIINPKGLLKLGRIYYGLEDVNELITLPDTPGATQGLMQQNIQGLGPADQQQQGRNNRFAGFVQNRIGQAMESAAQGQQPGQPGGVGIQQPKTQQAKLKTTGGPAIAMNRR